MNVVYTSYLGPPLGDEMAEGKEDKCSGLWSHPYRSPDLRDSKIYGFEVLVLVFVLLLTLCDHHRPVIFTKTLSCTGY